MYYPGGGNVRAQKDVEQNIKHVLDFYHNSAAHSLSGPNDNAVCLPSKHFYDQKDIHAESKYGSLKKVNRYWKRKTSGSSFDDEHDLAEHFNSEPIDKRKPFSAVFPNSVFSQPEHTWASLDESILEGKVISCFSVGGEKRLCLPQVLNSLLRSIRLADIYSACDTLRIFCATCSQQQLLLLKKCAVIPPTAAQCGLITHTDAERLWAELRPPPPAPERLRADSLPADGAELEVQHRCFGKSRGTVNTALYVTPMALCIVCHQCGGMFSPRRFVTHSHGGLETRVVHWGFDSANWRRYLLLSSRWRASDDTGRQLQQRHLDRFKSRFSSTATKLSPESCGGTDKRPRLSESPHCPSYPPSSTAISATLHNTPPSASACETDQQRALGSPIENVTHTQADRPSPPGQSHPLNRPDSCPDGNEPASAPTSATVAPSPAAVCDNCVSVGTQTDGASEAESTTLNCHWAVHSPPIGDQSCESLAVAADHAAATLHHFITADTICCQRRCAQLAAMSKRLCVLTRQMSSALLLSQQQSTTNSPPAHIPTTHTPTVAADNNTPTKSTATHTTVKQQQSTVSLSVCASDSRTYTRLHVDRPTEPASPSNAVLNH